MRRIALALVVCAAAGVFAPAARADDDVPLPFHVPANGSPVKPPDPDNFYKHTSRQYGTTSAGAVGYLVVGLAVGAGLLALFLRDTRQTFAPRRKQPWDNV